MYACLKCMGNNGFLSRLRYGKTRDKASTAQLTGSRGSAGMEVCTLEASPQFSECSHFFRIKYWGKNLSEPNLLEKKK